MDAASQLLQTLTEIDDSDASRDWRERERCRAVEAFVERVVREAMRPAKPLCRVCGQGEN